MRFEITHRTTYTYASPVRESFNEARLEPLSDDRQAVERFGLRIEPPARTRSHRDCYANVVHCFEVAAPHDRLVVESTVLAATLPGSVPSASVASWPLARMDEATRAPELFDFLEGSRYVSVSPEARRLAAEAAAGATDVWQAALAVMHSVHGHLAYEPNSTTVHTAMDEVLSRRRGVCQDYAHVMIGLCRALRIPARYVSGYLATEAARATHAWVETLIPGSGWSALDPTHARPIDEMYVKIAVGRDYADVAPVAGNYKGTTERRMEVAVDIRAL